MASVEYTPPHRYDKEPTPTTEGLFWWIQGNLKYGGIEIQLSKVVKLVTLMTEDFLVRNPQEIGNVADVLGCSGRDHKVVNDQD